MSVIVVGGGHAGCEAAAASARMGVPTKLITFKKFQIGELSCNPAMGGIGKGHLIKEIDALDGVLPEATDVASIHSKILNKSKGPAVWGPRTQTDRELYKKALQNILFNYPNLEIIQGEVVDLNIQNNKILGVTYLDENRNSTNLAGDAVILTVGTFLNGQIYVAEEITTGGRVGDAASIELANNMQKLGFTTQRLKTGTPCRLNRSSINWNILEKQYPDDIPIPMSYKNTKITTPQLPCYITHTNEKSHEIISKNLDKAGIYIYSLRGKGPRYCPSIEDKIVRFAEKKSHQIFLEIEGLESNRVYPNGISTSMPREIQLEFLRSIKGLEEVEIEQYGYVIEYDYIDPRNLFHSLETKFVSNLFCAGQINGTTGYEEAAGQGLIAGINAVLKLQNRPAFVLNRHEAYIGVMIDDLVLSGAPEPYRMFTSRAESRLLLRCDNADDRLSIKGYKLGVISDARYEHYQNKLKELDIAKKILNKCVLGEKLANSHNITLNSNGERRNALELYADKKITSLQEIYNIWSDIVPEITNVEYKYLELLAIQALYEPYISRQNRDIKNLLISEKMAIPEDFDYSSIGSLSAEVLEKLRMAQPKTVGAVSRVYGVTPSAVNAIILHLQKIAKRA